MLKRGTSQIATEASAVSYKIESTATVTAISPRTISVAGGETVTFTGTKLDTVTSVKIDEVACGSIAASSATTMTCVTGARTALKPATLLLPKANAPRDEINQVLGATHLELGCWALLSEDVVKVESELRQQNSLERCEPLEQARNGCAL